MYKVIVSKSAERELNGFSEKILERLLKGIRKLEKDPRPIGCKKLKGPDEPLSENSDWGLSNYLFCR